MKILSLKIQNFKTFGPEGISLSMTDLCALIGENNTGKSNILEALDLFFNFSQTKMSKRCFHHDDLSQEIIIEINFGSLSEEERKKFNIHLDEKKETLTITQKINLNLEEEQNIESVNEEDYKFEESKHGTKWETTLEWAKLGEKPPTKKDISKYWKEPLTIGDLNFKCLFNENNEPSPQVYQEKLELFWEKNFDSIPKQKEIGDEKVLGWKNKLKGNLPKFFYVPAIKHVDEDLRVQKTNPFGEMISWLTQNISNEVKKDFEAKTKTIVEEALSKIDQDDEGKSKIAYINEQLNLNLGVNLDCKLELKFGTPSISDIIFPSPRLYADDGYYSEVNSKGHGLQRLCILSLLRTYNELKKRTEKKEERNIIVAIEEPEIYLHPPLKRATHKLLRALSKNDQIIYTTHDSYFVDVEQFDEIRLFKKVKNGKPKTLVYEFSVDRLIQFYKNCYGLDVDEKSIRHRFGHICDETKNEGFFAKKAILIEGDTEKYALPIYFVHKNFDIDDERIAIISAGSAENITYLYVMFNEFHIPCYIIFDGDKPDIGFGELKDKKREDAKNKSRRNKEIIKLLGEQVDEKSEFFFPQTSVTNKYTVWEKNFEEIFHKPLENYEEIKGSAKRLYGTDSKPLTGRHFADVLTTKFPEKISPFVEEMIRKIKNCCWTTSCSDRV
jgi:putative ATP-dependent endonuclease of OLD family